LQGRGGRDLIPEGRSVVILPAKDLEQSRPGENLEARMAGSESPGNARGNGGGGNGGKPGR
jgi:hypothetical protein